MFIVVSARCHFTSRRPKLYREASCWYFQGFHSQMAMLSQRRAAHFERRLISAIEYWLQANQSWNFTRRATSPWASKNLVGDTSSRLTSVDGKDMRIDELRFWVGEKKSGVRDVADTPPTL
jgi:hypothetical protein